MRAAARPQREVAAGVAATAAPEAGRGVTADACSVACPAAATATPVTADGSAVCPSSLPSGSALASTTPLSTRPWPTSLRSAAETAILGSRIGFSAGAPWPPTASERRSCCLMYRVCRRRPRRCPSRSRESVRPRPRRSRLGPRRRGRTKDPPRSRKGRREPRLAGDPTISFQCGDEGRIALVTVPPVRVDRGIARCFQLAATMQFAEGRYACACLSKRPRARGAVPFCEKSVA